MQRSVPDNASRKSTAVDPLHLTTHAPREEANAAADDDELLGQLWRHSDGGAAEALPDAAPRKADVAAEKDLHRAWEMTQQNWLTAPLPEGSDALELEHAGGDSLSASLEREGSRSNSNSSSSSSNSSSSKAGSPPAQQHAVPAGEMAALRAELDASESTNAALASDLSALQSLAERSLTTAIAALSVDKELIGNILTQLELAKTKGSGPVAAMVQSATLLVKQLQLRSDGAAAELTAAQQKVRGAVPAATAMESTEHDDPKAKFAAVLAAATKGSSGQSATSATAAKAAAPAAPPVTAAPKLLAPSAAALPPMQPLSLSPGSDSSAWVPPGVYRHPATAAAAPLQPMHMDPSAGMAYPPFLPYPMLSSGSPWPMPASFGAMPPPMPPMAAMSPMSYGPPPPSHMAMSPHSMMPPFLGYSEAFPPLPASYHQPPTLAPKSAASAPASSPAAAAAPASAPTRAPAPAPRPAVPATSGKTKR